MSIKCFKQRTPSLVHFFLPFPIGPKCILHYVESLDELNERTLTNIASGQMLTNFNGDDFFGDNDYAGLGIEHYVNQNIMDGQTAAAGSDWTLPA